MNKEVFLENLKQKITSIPKKEQYKMIFYYDEYISDAVEAGQIEAEVINAIGSIDSLAEQLLENYDKEKVFTEAKEKPTLSNGFKVLIALLALFSVPLTIPLVIFVFVLALAFILLIVAILVAFLASSIALLITSIGLIVTAVQALVIAPGYGLALFAPALINFGLGILLLPALVKLVHLAIKLFAFLGNKLSSAIKRKDKKQNKLIVN
ncbi:hypothetical protein AZF37_07105 [endosymbiont 'TC1' of Trimyema compressum]|uniref:DUF1700 domain-containing protein n=1 Tax=endosymbiont 'TC1' of Trimyema compressum TaxID=243899 RepID=UPI0007F1380A|nr:DUF1700 domain-containing protein [endosymbiont 'TC1' of Trimyema compressum]AMP20958.1 hypothetical protein AZF37_07105 [endosymbiont 'TC1' of Trimyema compressum]